MFDHRIKDWCLVRGGEWGVREARGALAGSHLPGREARGNIAITQKINAMVQAAWGLCDPEKEQLSLGQVREGFLEEVVFEWT